VKIVLFAIGAGGGVFQCYYVYRTGYHIPTKHGVSPHALICMYNIRAQFYQRSTYNFNGRGAQKLKKDSQVISLFMLSESTCAKAERKYVGEIEPRQKMEITYKYL